VQVIHGQIDDRIHLGFSKARFTPNGAPSRSNASAASKSCISRWIQPNAFGMRDNQKIYPIALGEVHGKSQHRQSVRDSTQIRQREPEKIICLHKLEGVTEFGREFDLFSEHLFRIDVFRAEEGEARTCIERVEKRLFVERNRRLPSVLFQIRDANSSGNWLGSKQRQSRLRTSPSVSASSAISSHDCRACISAMQSFRE
jgi:hypothetical protein